MRKSDSKHSQETPEEELKRLRKEVARLEGKLEAQKQAANAKIVAAKAKMDEMRKELKKKYYCPLNYKKVSPTSCMPEVGLTFCI